MKEVKRTYFKEYLSVDSPSHQGYSFKSIEKAGESE